MNLSLLPNFQPAYKAIGLFLKTNKITGKLLEKSMFLRASGQGGDRAVAYRPLVAESGPFSPFVLLLYFGVQRTPNNQPAASQDAGDWRVFCAPPLEDKVCIARARALQRAGTGHVSDPH